MFATLGSFVAGLGTSVFDSLFGSLDEGHWQGNQFIPGDLQNRYNTVYQWIREFNLSPGQVDMQKIDSILKTPGVWQSKIRSYLASLQGTTSSSTTDNIFPNVGNITSGFDLTTILIIAALILGAYAFTKYKK